jgi:methylglyoxal synthase
MKSQMIEMDEKKKIALVAHDKKKSDLLEWAKFNRDPLAGHALYGTGTTEKFLEQKLKSGPQEFLD